MTSTFTLLNPSGIIMATDSRITYIDPSTGQILRHVDNIKKIYHFSKANVGVSYWGLAELQGTPMLGFLAEFGESSIDETDTVDTAASKLMIHLQNVAPRIRSRMGLHVAGYLTGEQHSGPRLRHVFHETWHPAGNFTNEDCHIERHQNGVRIPFPSRFRYPVLFNGDNAIANAFFNYISGIQNQQIRTDLLTIDECTELAKLIVGVSIQRLEFYVDTMLRRVPKTVGGAIHMARITKNGFKWIPTSFWQRIKVLFSMSP